MVMSFVTPQHVTNASGTIALASTSTSIGAQKIVNEAPASAEHMLHTANSVITTADMIALGSVSIMLASFLWNVYSSKKNRQIDEKFYRLRQEELALEMLKIRNKDEA